MSINRVSQHDAKNMATNLSTNYASIPFLKTGTYQVSYVPASSVVTITSTSSTTTLFNGIGFFLNSSDSSVLITSNSSRTQVFFKFIE